MTELDPGSRVAHWDLAYAAATASRSWYQSEPTLSRRLIEAAGFGRVLDVGGGTSYLAARLLASGYTQVGVLDISPAAISEARERLGADAGRVEWFVADVTSFDSPHPWEIWHDRAVFHFLTAPSDREAYRAVLTDSLVPGGQVILATFGPSGPEQCSGLPVVRYSAATLTAELGSEFRLVQSIDEAHTTPAGRVQDFLYCRFVRQGG